MPKPRCNNPSCGAFADEDDARFCFQCGAALARRIPPKLPPRPAPPPTGGSARAPGAIRDIAWHPGGMVFARGPSPFEGCTLAPPSRRVAAAGPSPARGPAVEFSSLALMVALVLALAMMAGGDGGHTARAAGAGTPSTLTWMQGRAAR